MAHKRHGRLTSRSQAPPLNSRPEAAEFPNEIYNMSSDSRLFQAPRYPQAPTGMYYQVPPTPPASERPKSIFPWESTAPKPTRVFADDPPKPPETTPSVTTDDDTQSRTASPTTPTFTPTAAQPFAAYQRTNAWDEVPEIERYISNLPQNRRGKVQVLMNNDTAPPTETNPPAPEASTSPNPQTPQQRRPSMKLTDFPTEIERPSLPVTPAPVRRPSFWGAERDAQGDLPGADGVPEQSEWNPVARLADLQRRQSDVLGAQGPASPPGPRLPDRELPGSASVPLSEVREDEGGGGAPKLSLVDADMPVSFQTLDFSGRAPGPGVREEVAPTES